MRQIASEEQSGKMASAMKVHTKQRCDIEFLHVEKIGPVQLSVCKMKSAPQSVDYGRGTLC
jgi:hypothetical protein